MDQEPRAADVIEVALERLGDREALRDHVRSFGCRLYFPREGLDRPERKPRRERR